MLHKVVIRSMKDQQNKALKAIRNSTIKYKIYLCSSRLLRCLWWQVVKVLVWRRLIASAILLSSHCWFYRWFRFSCWFMLLQLVLPFVCLVRPPKKRMKIIKYSRMLLYYWSRLVARWQVWDIHKPIWGVKNGPF